MIALMAWVVPWMKLSPFASSSLSSIPRACAATPSASMTPMTGSLGTVGALCRVMRPSSSSTTRSVKVPPVSVAKRIGLKAHLVAALQPQHRAGLVRGRDLDVERFEDRAHFRHLLRVARRQFALADIEAVLQPAANAAAQQRALRQELHLRPPDRESGERVIVAEQPVGRLLERHEVFQLGADSAQDPENALDQERRLLQARIDEMLQIVEVADIIDSNSKRVPQP